MEFNVMNDPAFSSQELPDVVDAVFVLGNWAPRAGHGSGSK